MDRIPLFVALLCLAAITHAQNTTDGSMTTMAPILNSTILAAIITTSSPPPPPPQSDTTTSASMPQTSTPFIENPPITTTTTMPPPTTQFVENPTATTTTMAAETTTTTPPTTPPFTTPFVESPTTSMAPETTTTTPPTTFVENPTTTTTTTTVKMMPTTTTPMPTTTTTMKMMQTTPSGDCYLKKADIVFLLDASTSEGSDNFKKQLAFVNTAVGRLDVRPDGVRVGLVTFSDDAHLQFNLKDHMDKNELQLALKFVPYQNGATHTEDGLQYIRDNSFNAAAGGRTDAQRVVVVMTDGQSTNPSATLQEARLLRRNNTIIVSVGIGSNVDAKELQGIASGKNYTLQIGDFDSLGDNLDSLLTRVCDAINGVDGGELYVPCQERAVDLAILLDASGSEGLTHFREQTNFAADFVSQLDIGITKTQVGAITFSTDVYRQFFLNQYDDTNSVVAAIKRIPYTGGTTNTQKALQYMMSTLFTQGYGHRPGAPKVIIIMTDGQSTSPSQTLAQANLLKKEGYIVFAIGIGNNLQMTEINNIASSQDMAYQVRTFDDLQAFLPKLQADYCNKIDSIPPFVPTQDPSLANCNKPSDLVFVLDSSSSEGTNNYRKQVYFAGNITQRLNIGPNNVQVSMLAFSSTPHNVFFLDRYDNKYDVLDAISRTPYYAGSTYTDEALMFVRLQTLSTLNGRRLGAQPIVIVLTDGQSTDKTQTLAEAQLLQSTGAVVIAIGIGGNVDQVELNAIASDPAHKFNVNSFDFLFSIQQQILQETCEGSGPPPTAHPECGDKPADIVFLMDASSSEGPLNFEKMKSFIADFSSQFTVGKGHVQISCVAFSTSVHIEFDLDDAQSRTELLQKITNIRFYGGTTMTDKALEAVRTQVLTTARGARPNAADTVILLTDGRSVVASETQRQADLLKQMGVQVISIGVGSSVDGRELEAIASDVQHAFSVINFDALKSIEKELVQTACESCRTTEKADILVILDSSSDESSQLFNQEIDFVSNLVKQFQIGPQNTQFSALTFAEKPNLEFWFRTYDNKQDILDALPKVVYTQGATNTDKALEFARYYALKSFNGARADASQYILVVTDGTAANITNTVMEADKLKAQGVTIMAVGIGKNADKAELESIATDPSHVFIADNADALKTIHRDVTVRTCKSIFELKTTTASPIS